MKDGEKRHSRENDRTPIRVATETEAEILGLLISGTELFGLEMVRRSEGRLKRAVIYVFLHRMEKQGLVHSRVDDQHENRGPPRRKYRITALGRKAFAARQAAQLAFNESGCSGQTA